MNSKKKDNNLMKTKKKKQTYSVHTPILYFQVFIKLVQLVTKKKKNTRPDGQYRQATLLFCCLIACRAVKENSPCHSYNISGQLELESL